MPRLGVNIDHVATLRQARGGHEPDPIMAASLVQLAGADGIVVHLREDRRHIQDRDFTILREMVHCQLNLEMAAEESIAKIALNVKPDLVTLVPERRQELTTEGGLAVAEHRDRIQAMVQLLHDGGIPVSLFIDPDLHQVKAAHKIQADLIELHTGKYAHTRRPADQASELNALVQAAKLASKLGLRVSAGHGLHYLNVQPLTRIVEIEEFNIGHSIISRALFIGIERAVKEMKHLIG
jgi:pyridoxine 5-phosphate synthase